MNSRIALMIGIAAAAGIGTWFKSRSRVSRANLGDVAGWPALRKMTPFSIADDRAADIIKQYSPALQAIAREV
jgi:hypothetical protein